MNWNSDFIEENTRKIHYYSGDVNGPPIIFLHGAWDNGLCWIHIAGKLREQYYVIMPDARFHGQTKVPEKKFTYEAMAEDVYVLIKALKLENVVLIGHSMGGSIAALVAATYPDLINKVILEDPGLKIGDYSWFTKRLFQFFAIFIAPIILRGSYEKLLKRCKKSDPTWPEEVYKPWAESKVQYKKNHPTALLGFLSQKYDWKAIIKEIQCPLLLITASKGLTSDKFAKEVIKFSKKGKWVKIDNSGHSIRRDQPEKYLKTVLEFLD